MRPIPLIAAQQCGVFSARQALLDGWTPSALAHAVRNGRLHRIRTGAYQVTDLRALVPELNQYDEARWRHAATGVAAALTTAGVASHSTAAVLAHVPLIFLPEQACVCVVPWWTGRIPGVHLHRCGLPARSDAALATTSAERTVIDLAREHGVASGVVAADHALHVGLSTHPRLAAELARCRGWPGVRAARESIAFADGRSESVLESRSRLALHQWGLPKPELQVNIGTPGGRFVARVDFYWDEFGVVGEADGDVKYDGTDPAALIAEKDRQSALEELDLVVVRWGTRHLRGFGEVAVRLRRAYARGARTPRSARLWRVLPPL